MDVAGITVNEIDRLTVTINLVEHVRIVITLVVDLVEMRIQPLFSQLSLVHLVILAQIAMVQAL